METRYTTEYLRNRKRNGLCLRCGKPMDREGALCQSCLEKDREYHQRLNDTLIARGICTTCHKRKTDGFKTCPECRAKANKRTHIYYKHRKMGGDAGG